MPKRRGSTRASCGDVVGDLAVAEAAARARRGSRRRSTAGRGSGIGRVLAASRSRHPVVAAGALSMWRAASGVGGGIAGMTARHARFSPPSSTSRPRSPAGAGSGPTRRGRPAGAGDRPGRRPAGDRRPRSSPAAASPPAEAAAYLAPALRDLMPDPSRLRDMDRAAARFWRGGAGRASGSRSSPTTTSTAAPRRRCVLAWLRALGPARDALRPRPDRGGLRAERAGDAAARGERTTSSSASTAARSATSRSPPRAAT